MIVDAPGVGEGAACEGAAGDAVGAGVASGEKTGVGDADAWEAGDGVVESWGVAVGEAAGAGAGGGGANGETTGVGETDAWGTGGGVAEGWGVAVGEAAGAEGGAGVADGETSGVGEPAAAAGEGLGSGATKELTASKTPRTKPLEFVACCGGEGACAKTKVSRKTERIATAERHRRQEKKRFLARAEGTDFGAGENLKILDRSRFRVKGVIHRPEGWESGKVRR